MKEPFVFGIALLLVQSVVADVLSRSFELRYVSDDTAANGETGFKGKGEIFNTDERIEYLEHYADYAKGFFNDPLLNQKVVSLDQAEARLASIKPQPQPWVRKRFRGAWKAYGYEPGKHEASVERIAHFGTMEGAKVDNGVLEIRRGRPVVLKFEKQDWRLSLTWDFKAAAHSQYAFRLGEAAHFDSSDGKTGDEWVTVNLELDFENQRYNAYLNDQLIKDFVPFDRKVSVVSGIEITTTGPIRIDNLHGIGYTKDYEDGTENLHSRDKPFLVNTFLDDHFGVDPDIDEWMRFEYDDSTWETVELPHAHGGERFRNESLYLRKKIKIPASGKVTFHAESFDPSGELWVNGRPVFVASNRHPVAVDITRFVKVDEENIFAIRIDPFKVGKTMRHTSADEYIGWFCGRAFVDCTSKTYIRDVFSITDTIGDQAELTARIWVEKTEESQTAAREIKKLQSFSGQLKVKLYKWFPHESGAAVAEGAKAFRIRDARVDRYDIPLIVKEPDLWSPDDCHLYKLRAELYDATGTLIDDYVVTTGIRTVSQEGGTFRINGEPSMMNGALLFSVPSPMEKMAQWQRCPPSAYIIKDLMQLKALNGNTARMSQHHGPAVSINDPRYAEFGDQLGILFQWATTSWVRTASPWQLDFEGLDDYVRQVRNHPSIVMWQPANHPKFIHFEEAMEWFEKVYETLWSEDPTRLINPTANLGRIGTLRPDHGRNKDGLEDALTRIWTLPSLTRGSMERMTGYGKNWDALFSWPNAKADVVEQNWGMGELRVDYLASQERAFFDFESEESAGQPNWSLRKGKPSYQVMSYEWIYDVGSIGTYLTVDQWQESQAWQAFSAFEAYKKKRWLDYDGQAWCSLRGGANSATYQKPLIDYDDHAKLSFYAVKMAFQSVLAGSKNADIAYGPADNVPLVVMNLGQEKGVTVTVNVKEMNGDLAYSKSFENVVLPEGRTFTDLSLDISRRLEAGFYAFEYEVTQAGEPAKQGTVRTGKGVISRLQQSGTGVTGNKGGSL